MAQTIDARVKQKTGTAAEFAGYTLLAGEIALVRTSASGPVWNFKVGPGNFDSLDWSLQNPGAAQKADTSTVFPVGVPGLYIPTVDGTYEGVTVDLSAGYTQLIWDGSTLVKVEFPIDLSGYATTAEVSEIRSMVGTFEGLGYTGSLAFREYTSGTVFNTDNPDFSQTDNGGSDTVSLSASATNFPVLFVDTGVALNNAKKLTGSFRFNNIISSGAAIGLGFVIGGTYLSVLYRSGGDIITTTPFNPTVRVSGLDTYGVGDNIYLEVYPNESTTVFAFYKNGEFVGSYTYTGLLTGNVFLSMRGRGEFVASKLAYVTERYATQQSVEQVSDDVTDLANSINKNYPFHPDATFINGESTDVSWLKDAIVELKMSGFDVNDKISPFVVRKAYGAGSQYMFSMWQDNGDGSGVPEDRVKVLEWFENNYTPPSGLDTIRFTDGDKSMLIVVDWSKVPSGQSTQLNYNCAGLAVNALINFSSAGPAPQPLGGVSVSWHYNDSNAPVTGTDRFAQFTVVPNVDEDNDTVGCTGASYNPDTEEYVISYYSYAKAAELWMYKRQDLVPYSPSGTIVPVPTRKIDVSSHIYHIQGNVYDPQLKSYWILGAENPASSDTERLLIRVDDEGNLLERYSLSSYSFQAGMIALSPDGQNLMIKPNNQTWLLEINKFTKSQVRQVTTATAHEGLAVDALKSLVWVGGNDGNLYVYDYTTMVLQDTIAYETLPDGGTMNIEGMIIDPIDGAVIVVADAYLHGANNNGNCMWVFDFDKTIGKQVRFPDMMPWQGNESVIVDFGSSNNLVAAVLESGTGTIQYRGSNTAPTLPAVNRTNWRDRPYYGSWGSTIPSAWSDTMTSYRYMQLRVV